MASLGLGIIDLGNIPFHPTQRQKFTEGILPKEWHNQYPMLLDDDDLRIATTQAKYAYHYYEWLAAIVLFNSTGYFSLVEKYQFLKHHAKQDIIRKIASPKLNDALIYQKEHREVQAPDLLVYSFPEDDWFFCEVKGGKDHFSTKQIKHFNALAAISGKPVYSIRIDTIDQLTYR
jgi:hypothetical protein